MQNMQNIVNTKNNKPKNKKRIRIDIRTLLEDLDMDKNESSKSSTIIYVNEKSKDFTPMISNKNGFKTANNSYKFHPNFERKGKKKPTPTFKPKSSMDLKRLKKTEEESAMVLGALVLNSENNFNHLHVGPLNQNKENVNTFNAYNSAFSLMNDRKLKSQISQISLKKKGGSKKNSFIAKESAVNLITYSPRFEFNDFMGSLGK
jgi:hypothetical protein